MAMIDIADEIPPMKEARDFHRECLLLAQALGKLRPEQWSSTTLFKNWTPWDIVAHLAIADSWALATLRSREDFGLRSADVNAALGRGVKLTEYTRQHFGNIGGAELLDTWLTQVSALCARFDAIEPERRFAWFGPDMSVQTMAVARYMEVWAHGQAIYDLSGLPRVLDDAIKSIAFLGVRTFSFAYRNRGLPVPPKPPLIRLTSPTGEIWLWNEESPTDVVEGPAGEFCQVVTQCRNVADTSLRVMGATANEWMSIAQCFAGPPESPPPPGVRKMARAAGRPS